MAAKTDSINQLSKTKKGYFLAVLGGTAGLPIGWILSPIVLYLLNLYIKDNEQNPPNRFKVWAIIGIFAAPMCYLPFVFFDGDDQAVVSKAPAVVQNAVIEKSDAQKLMAELLGELDQIRESDEFKFYGLGQAGPYSDWLLTAQERADKIDMHLIEETAIGYVMNLARSYAISKGRETESIKNMRNEVQEVIDWRQIDVNDSSQWPPSWR